MTCGIYCIEHVSSKKKYIGKSVNIENRFSCHRWQLKQKEKPKDCNPYLFSAVKKYKIENFIFYIVEECERNKLLERELFWMDVAMSCQSETGYNLRRDSSSGMEVHPKTLEKMSRIFSGESNPNFGNRWTDEQKIKMSENAKLRHSKGLYGEDWKKKISETSKKLWLDTDKKAKVANSVKLTKQAKNAFLQFERDGTFIRKWETVEQIIAENPSYKWQNIYSVCNGYKPTYRGFIWKKIKKTI